MLAPLTANRQRSRIAAVFSMSSPVKGLNSRDSLSDTPVGYALTMDNFIPELGSVSLRGGFMSHATGMDGAIETLATYNAVDGSEKLFAFNGSDIYDCTLAGAAASVYSTGITSQRWQTINFSTQSTLHILAVNGQDTPLKYNGTSWTTNSITGSIVPADMIGIFAHKERVWLIEKESLNVWYLASGAVGGAATKYPLTGVFNLGGSIVAGSDFSLSGTGEGMDSLWVIVTNKGEVAIYSGTNPATDFTLIGLYRIGEPLGYRCLVKYGGDLNVLTSEGIVSLRRILSFDRTRQAETSITDLIAPSFNADVKRYGSNYGWEGIIYPRGHYALFNVPVSDNVTQTQWVQNTITGGWCRFKGWNANTFALMASRLYFGGNDGVVYKADSGLNDDGSQITGEIKTAFTYCKTPGIQKQFTLFRPVITASGSPAIDMALNVDFADDPATSSLSAVVNGDTVWGSARWGSGKWGGTGLVIRDWISSGIIGNAVAIKMRVATDGIAINVNAFDLTFERGGVL